MKKSFIALIFITMISFGVICGIAFYVIFISSTDNLILHCALLGALFGLLNSFISLYFIKKYKAINIKNESLKHELRKDKLTGLYSRYAYMTDYETVIPDISYSLIYLDIDDFRKFNNNYGHAAGDDVLINCANIIKNSIRSSDMAYRYGGEEILVVLSGCKKNEAIKIGQNIITNVHDFNNKPYPQITISAGIATIPDDAFNFEQLIKASDAALLTAKRQGKNQVIASS